MSCLYNCGVCCMLLSIWAVIQLILMGILYQMEATPMIKDVAAEHYTDYEDFIKQTTTNYRTVAMNCWIAAAAYFLMIGISILCIVKAGRSDKLKAIAMDDDEAVCGPLDDTPKRRRK